MRHAGAKEVHVLVSSPPVVHSCYFGIDTPERKELVGAVKTVDEICQMIGADSLGYISVEGLMKSVHKSEKDLCVACFNGNYPIDVPKSASKFMFETNKAVEIKNT